MLTVRILSICLLLINLIDSKVYFEEDFENSNKWIKTTKNVDTLGDMKISQLKYSEEGQTGFKTTQDSKFYHYAAKLDSPFHNHEKNLILQYSLVNEQILNCGGGYIKLLPTDKISEFDGQSDYDIMFGPDACGSKQMIHLILKNKILYSQKREDIQHSSSQDITIFTIIITKDKKYEVKVNGEKKANGKIDEDFNIFGQVTIADPDDTKPDNWVEIQEIDDPEDKKPEDFDKPENIIDTNATKPSEWDDIEDGEWTAPMKPNPDFQGEWKPKKIPNPEYKGEWKQKQIPNPDYHKNSNYCEYIIESIGIDLWQVQSGTIFDRILLTDDLEYAEKHLKESLKLAKEHNSKREKVIKEEEELKKKEEEKNKSKEEPEKTVDDTTEKTVDDEL